MPTHKAANHIPLVFHARVSRGINPYLICSKVVLDTLKDFKKDQHSDYPIRYKEIVCTIKYTR